MDESNTSASIVFDYYPRGTPVVYNEAMEAKMNEVLEGEELTGRIGDLATEALRDEAISQLRTDPDFREEFRANYEESGVTLVSPTVGRGRLDDPVTQIERVTHQLARWHAMIHELEWMHLVTSPDEARAVADRGEVGILLNVQNIGVEVYENLARLEEMHNFGITIMQLTYNSQNLIGSSANERVDGGLSEHGIDVVEKLNEMDVIIDVSHVGTQSIRDAAEASSSPIIGTHMPQTTFDYDEGLIEERVEPIAASDGYVGLTILPAFVAPDRQDEAFEIFFDRIEYIADLIGVDRVGIGTDWGRWTVAQPEPLQAATRDKYLRTKHYKQIKTGLNFGPMTRYADWQEMPRELEARGFTESEVAGICGENFMSAWERIVSS